MMQLEEMAEFTVKQGKWVAEAEWNKGQHWKEKIWSSIEAYALWD